MAPTMRIATLVAVLLYVSPAAGTTPEQRANQLYNEGKELLAKGEIAQAVDRFTLAWNIFPHPLILKKRAEAREKLLQYEEAITDYRTYLARLKPRKRKERRMILERMESLEALLQKPVGVTLVSSRPGVLIAVDNGVSRRTPFELQLSPGMHRADLRDRRFAAKDLSFRVKPGKPQVVRVDAVPKTGSVVIATDRGSFEGTQIALDRTPILLSKTDREGERLPPRSLVIGSHSIVCSMQGVPNFYLEFEVLENGSTTITCQFDPLVGGSAIRDPWGWVTVAGAVAGLAAGTGLFISWAQDVKKAEDENLELITDKHIWGGVSLGIGVALGIGSYFVFTRNRGKATAELPVMPSLVLLPGGGAASATWRF